MRNALHSNVTSGQEIFSSIVINLIGPPLYIWSHITEVSHAARDCNAEQKKKNHTKQRNYSGTPGIPTICTDYMTGGDDLSLPLVKSSKVNLSFHNKKNKIIALP